LLLKDMLGDLLVLDGAGGPHVPPAFRANASEIFGINLDRLFGLRTQSVERIGIVISTGSPE
jgi:hypothetical protein